MHIRCSDLVKTRNGWEWIGAGFMMFRDEESRVLVMGKPLMYKYPGEDDDEDKGRYLMVEEHICDRELDLEKMKRPDYAEGFSTPRICLSRDADAMRSAKRRWTTLIRDWPSVGKRCWSDDLE